MRRGIIIFGCLVLILLIGSVVFRLSEAAPQFRAETIVVMRPSNNAVLERDFQRQIIKSNPGVIRLRFQTSTLSSTTLKGTTTDTNIVIQLIAAGSSAAEAEGKAIKAAQALCAKVRQIYGTTAEVLDPAHNVRLSSVQDPFRLRFGLPHPGPFPTIGPVYFPKAGISLDPGDGWMRHYVPGNEQTCELVIHGKGGSIHAWKFGPDFTNVESAVTSMRPQIEQQQGYVEASFNTEPFTSESGLHGMHVSFTRKYPAPNFAQGGMQIMTQSSHRYVITNPQQRCITVDYNTTSGTESEPVREVIRKTLKLQGL